MVTMVAKKAAKKTTRQSRRFDPIPMDDFTRFAARMRMFADQLDAIPEAAGKIGLDEVVIDGSTVFEFALEKIKEGIADVRGKLESERLKRML